MADIVKQARDLSNLKGIPIMKARAWLKHVSYSQAKGMSTRKLMGTPKSIGVTPALNKKAIESAKNVKSGKNVDSSFGAKKKRTPAKAATSMGNTEAAMQKKASEKARQSKMVDGGMGKTKTQYSSSKPAKKPISKTKGLTAKQKSALNKKPTPVVASSKKTKSGGKEIMYTKPLMASTPPKKKKKPVETKAKPKATTVSTPKPKARARVNPKPLRAAARMAKTDDARSKRVTRVKAKPDTSRSKAQAANTKLTNASVDRKRASRIASIKGKGSKMTPAQKKRMQGAKWRKYNEAQSKKHFGR